MFDRNFFTPDVPNVSVGSHMQVKGGVTLISGHLLDGEYAGQETLVFMNGAACFGVVLDDDARRFLRTYCI